LDIIINKDPAFNIFTCTGADWHLEIAFRSSCDYGTKPPAYKHMILDRTEENWIQSKCHRTDIFIGLLEHTQPYKDSPTLAKIRLKICKQQCKQTIGNYFHTDRQTAGMKRNCRGQDMHETRIPKLRPKKQGEGSK
jgi:hypothetical protein